MRRITIKHLAEKLNISISTVSRALSDSHEIGQATRLRVKQLAQELNYQPDLYASTLRSRKSKTISVIIPEITNSFFALAIDGIEEVARQKGYHVLIHITHENQLNEAEVVRHLLNGRIDGVLLSVTSQTNDTSHIDLLQKIKIPVVFFDRICSGFETTKVMTDDFKSGMNAVDHLVQRGCRTICYLSLSGSLSIDQKRKEGYLSACRKHAIEPVMVNCTSNDTENKEIIRTLLTGSERTLGVFASVEKLALTTYEVCNELQLDIPRDVKVISFSNLKTAALLNPPLTTIVQPAFEIGKAAATSLFNRLKNNLTAQEHEEIIIPSTLIARRSTELS